MSLLLGAVAYGVLTDGLRWKFFTVNVRRKIHQTGDLQHFTGIHAEIVDILAAWMQGLIPDDMFKEIPFGVSTQVAAAAAPSEVPHTG